jgi:hypothetical protein
MCGSVTATPPRVDDPRQSTTTEPTLEMSVTVVRVNVFDLVHPAASAISLESIHRNQYGIYDRSWLVKTADGGQPAGNP